MKQKEYVKWIESHTINPEIKEQLFLMSQADVDDAFSKKLQFGTAGLRGKIGPGTNRMNHYVVAKSTLGFIEYLKEKHPLIYEKGVVIAYDNRKFSQEFAALSANLFASMQIKVYIFENLRPTPQLSFMIKHKKACAGINITASHNSAEYNGYKVYDNKGCQILPDEINKIVYHIDQIKDELAIDIENFDNNEQLIEFLDESYDDEFIEAVLETRIDKNPKNKETSVVYTPLHGTGGTVLSKVFTQAGYNNVFVVNNQMIPDENFSTVPNPNPEDLSAFAAGIDKANQLRINYVIATDPDADRVGVCVRKNNTQFKLLTGNELGALLLNYILTKRKEQDLLQENSLMVDTIVTSDLGKEIARKYELYNISVLTGFKYIGNLVNEFNESKEFQFEFGYEESLGFLSNPYIADKDAISMSLIILEMINHYASLDKTLLDGLSDIYEEFGYYLNKQISIQLDPKNAQTRIDTIMEYFKNPELEQFVDTDIIEIADYEKQVRYFEAEETKIMLPKENALKIILDDQSWIAIRPSGTEPKLKVYLGAKADSYIKVKQRIKELQDAINLKLEELFK